MKIIIQLKLKRVKQIQMKLKIFFYCFVLSLLTPENKHFLSDFLIDFDKWNKFPIGITDG